MILALDTSGALGGLALVGPEHTEARDLGERGRHAELAVAAAQELVLAAGGWTRITRIAAAVGPGSFTGIRVGMAAAQGFAQARRIPLTGVRSLDIHAWACYDAISLAAGSYIVSAVDVRRGEAVVATYRVEAAGPVRLAEDQLVSVRDPGLDPVEDAVLTGDASGVLWADRSLRRIVAPGPDRARAAGRLAAAFPDGTFEPRYARAADARKPER